MDNLIIQLGTGKYVEKSSVTMYSIGKKYIEEEYLLHQFIDSSYIRKLGTLEQIKQHYIAVKPIQTITGYDVKDFYIYIGNNFSNSVIEKICGLCNTIFQLALKRNIVTYNFFDDLLEYKRPKSIIPPKKIMAFTIDEQKRYIDVIMNKEPKILYRVQFILSMFCGMRMGEINALYLSDINLEENSISIKRTLTKNKKEETIMGTTTKTYAGKRTIYFNNDVKTALVNYINDNFKPNQLKKDILLFPNRNPKKTYISTSQVNSAFKRLCQKHNISKGWDVNQHMLRHTFATRCIEAGMNAKVLQKILGHKKITTTLDTYCDVFDEYEKKHNDLTFEYLQQNNLILFNDKSVQ